MTGRPNDRTPCAHGSDKKRPLHTFTFTKEQIILPFNFLECSTRKKVIQELALKVGALIRKGYEIWNRYVKVIKSEEDLNCYHILSSWTWDHIGPKFQNRQRKEEIFNLWHIINQKKDIFNLWHLMKYPGKRVKPLPALGADLHWHQRGRNKAAFIFLWHSVCFSLTFSKYDKNTLVQLGALVWREAVMGGALRQDGSGWNKKTKYQSIMSVGDYLHPLERPLKKKYLGGKSSFI